MRTIWKYPIPITDEFTLELPFNSKILYVGWSRGSSIFDVAHVWVLIPDTEAYKIERKFHIFGTGNPIMENENRLQYIGTFKEDKFVWHLFEETI